MKALPTGLSTRSKSLPTRSIFCIRAALDVPLAKLFDYSVPADMEARVGDRVVVPFGARQRLAVVIEGGVTSTLRAKPFAQRGAGARPRSNGERARPLQRVLAARRDRQRKDRGVPAPHCQS